MQLDFQNLYLQAQLSETLTLTYSLQLAIRNSGCGRITTLKKNNKKEKKKHYSLKTVNTRQKHYQDKYRKARCSDSKGYGLVFAYFQLLEILQLIWEISLINNRK